MYQKSAQKLSKVECYPESVMEKFKNFSASLDDLMPYYYCHDLFLACNRMVSSVIEDKFDEW